MSTLPTPATRQQLIALLTDACELEHGIACSYLYAAFSLKKQPSDGGLTPEQLRLTRYWASQIYFVAAEEMLHLAQAWNLLTSIGGSPYCLRPNLPQNSRYYPIHAQLALERFSEHSLRRFITYETPARSASGGVRFTKSETARGHVSIGELYQAIGRGFEKIPGLFVGDPADQVGAGGSVLFTDLIEVHDQASALQAVKMITHQGEGIARDRMDCHYGVFRALLKELRSERQKSGKRFEPARPAMDNPVADSTNGYGAIAHPIKNATSRRAATLFDGIYTLMLQALAFAFAPAGQAGAAARAASAAIEIMAAAIRPLGEALTRMPLGKGRLKAGPAFGLVRFVSLPSEAAIAMPLITQQLKVFSAEAAAIAHCTDPAVIYPEEFAVVAARLNEIADRLSGASPPDAPASAVRASPPPLHPSAPHLP